MDNREQAVKNAQQTLEQNETNQTIKEAVWDKLRQLLEISVLEKVEVYVDDILYEYSLSFQNMYP